MKDKNPLSGWSSWHGEPEGPGLFRLLLCRMGFHRFGEWKATDITVQKRWCENCRLSTERQTPPTPLLNSLYCERCGELKTYLNKDCERCAKV